ncbi:TonB-dependent receptor [candidate division KSB1 bacterium]|nr:TonB-dependent receptor [candidate division KSB1 bacterium]
MIRKLSTFLLFVSIVSSAQNYGRINGVVLDAYTHRVLPYANILVDGTTRGAAADTSGCFNIYPVKPGLYTLKAQMIGYEPQTRKINVTSSGTLYVEFQLRESFFQTEQVVVTATRTQNLLENVPVMTELITKTEIQESGAENLAQVLEDHPGLAIEDDVAGGQILRMNGIDGKYVLILIDGVPIAGKFNNRTQLNHIEADGIDHIEIVKGAGSALYGSEAMGGVVNIITRDFSDDFRIDARGQIGSYRYYSGHVDISGTTKGAGYLLNADHAQGGIQKGEISMNVTDTQNSSINGKLDFKNTAAGDFLVSAGIHQNIQNGEDPVFYNETRVTRQNASLTWSKEQKVSTIHTQAFFSGYHRTYSETVIHSGYLARRDSIAESLYGIKSDLNKKLSPNSRLDFGIDYLFDVFQSERIKDEKTGRSQIGIFSQSELDLYKKLNIIIGARYDYISNVGSHLSPRLNAMYTITSQCKLRAAWGGGFRAPSFTDMYIDYNNIFVGYRVEGNPELKPEKSQSTSFGLEYFWNHSLLINANIYHYTFTDMIFDYTKSPGVLSYKNIENASFTGVELQGKFYLRKNCSIVLSYNYSDIQKNIRDEVSNISPHTALFKLNYSIFKNRLKLTFKDQFFGEKDVRPFERQTGAYTEKFQIKKPYHLIDISLFWKMKKFLTLQAGVTNLNDYTDQTYGPWIGRRYFSALEIEYLAH